MKGKSKDQKTFIQNEIIGTTSYSADPFSIKSKSKKQEKNDKGEKAAKNVIIRRIKSGGTTNN